MESGNYPNSRRKRAGSSRGFTLVDVLLAILVMTVGLTGLMAMQMTSITAGSRAREIAEATAVCQSKVEQLLATPTPLPLPPKGGEKVDARGCLVTGDTRAFCAQALQGVVYTRTWTLDAATPENFEVRTEWRSADGLLHAVVLTNER